MSLFSSRDPKDELIDSLKNERDYLRAKITELEKQLLALTSSYAYRLVHGPIEDKHEARPLPLDPIALRSKDHEPSFSLADVESKFKQQDS